MSSIVISGDTSGSVTLQAPAVAGSTVITLPSTSTTLVSSQWTTSGANIFYNTGNVGVGAAPDSTFYVGGGALGTIRFFYNGTSVNYNDVDTQIWRTAGASEIMRITSTGLRIGTTSSTSLGSTTYKGLFVNSGANASIGVQGGTYTQPYYGQIWLSGGYGDGTTARTSGFFIRSQAVGGGGSIQNNLLFVAQTDNGISESEYARIDSSGNLLVGTTSNTSHTLQQTTANTYTTKFISPRATGSDNYGLFVNYTAAAPNGTGNAFLDCNDNAANRISLRSNGGIANYSSNNVNLSDRREKTNFAPAKSYLDVICAIPVQTFNYIDQNLEEDGGLTLGVVAQDVQAVAPELVMESNWGTQEDPKMRLSIYQTDLQYALMKCIQEQQALITTLTDRISVLENK